MTGTQILDAALRTDFPTFFRKAFPILNPGTPYEPAWHVDAIAHVLEDMRVGRRRRQIINMPPRTLKSQAISVAWPAFLLGGDPTLKIIVASYSEPLATQLSNDTRRLMQSDVYRRLFPGTRLSRQASDHLETDQGGQRFPTTVGGATTGFGADWIIMDDPHSASEAMSEVARERVWSYFAHTLSSRLNSPADGRIVVVMQRLHEDDLAGRLLQRGGWDHLKLQAQATEPQTVPTGSGQVHDVRVGDLLMPARLPVSFLDDQQRLMGSATYAAQYLQEPTPAEGGMIKRSWLRYGPAPPREGCPVMLSVDAAVKDNPANDYSVCTVWQEHEGKHHLMDVWREKVDFPGLKANILRLRSRYGAERVLIEDAASGSALIQQLQHEGLPAIPCKATSSKEARLSSASALLEAGLVVLPTDAPWLAAFETELLRFPAGRHDDQVDSLSQYLNWVGGRPNPSQFQWDFIDVRAPGPEFFLSALHRHPWR